MTAPENAATGIDPTWPSLDESGNLLPATAETCLAVFTDWARHYPCARFLVIAMAPDGTDATELGWGLALPEGVHAHLPEIRLTGEFTTAGHLLRLLRHGMDARLIWVDPEPEYLGDDADHPSPAERVVDG